jgi:hypothetical protein
MNAEKNEAPIENTKSDQNENNKKLETRRRIEDLFEAKRLQQELDF